MSLDIKIPCLDRNTVKNILIIVLVAIAAWVVSDYIKDNFIGKEGNENMNRFIKCKPQGKNIFFNDKRTKWDTFQKYVAVMNKIHQTVLLFKGYLDKSEWENHWINEFGGSENLSKIKKIINTINGKLKKSKYDINMGLDNKKYKSDDMIYYQKVCIMHNDLYEILRQLKNLVRDNPTIFDKERKWDCHKNGQTTSYRYNDKDIDQHESECIKDKGSWAQNKASNSLEDSKIIDIKMFYSLIFNTEMTITNKSMILDLVGKYGDNKLMKLALDKKFDKIADELELSID